MDLRVYPKHKKFVVQDMENNRKQIGKAYQSKSAANAACKKLYADVATKKVVISDRYNFKDEFKKYAEEKLRSAEDITVAATKASIRSYESFYRNYIADCFPDYIEEKKEGAVVKRKSCIYLDEITGPALHAFVKCCYQKKKATWKTVKIIISHIKSFLRDCDGDNMAVNRSVFNWKISKKKDLHPDNHDLKYPKKSTPIMPDEAAMLIDSLYTDRNKDFYTAYKLAIITTFTFTGLRFSELKGILKKYIDLLEDKTTTIIISCDMDDKSMQEDHIKEIINQYKNVKLCFSNNKSKIEAVNADLESVDFDIVLLASDDMIPQLKGYDTTIKKNMKDHFPDTDGVLWYNDGYQGKKLNTLCILGKKYYDRFGYIYQPDYKSGWCDNEYTLVANLLNKQVYFDNVIIKHEHPDYGFGKYDYGYKRNVKDLSWDKNIFKKRKANNFDLKIPIK